MSYPFTNPKDLKIDYSTFWANFFQLFFTEGLSLSKIDSKGLSLIEKKLGL